MKSMLKAASVTVLLAAATSSMAQTSTGAQAFAEQLRQYQSLSGTGEAWTERPAMSNVADDPVGNQSFSERFAQMQADSSRSSQFQQPAYASASTVGRSLASAPTANANPIPQAY